MKRSFDRIFDKSKYGEDWTNFKQSNPLKNKLCCKCNKPATERHHVIPVNRGGAHAEYNVQFICSNCHSLEHRHMRRKRMT